MSGASNRLIRPVGRGQGQPATEVFRKSFGEPIPQIVDISKNPFLTALFGQQGAAEKIRRKLVLLSRKGGKIVPAKGIVASALSASEATGNQDLVFVGVEFLAEYHPQESTLAGILAHEWGHLVSEFPKGLNPDDFSMDQIFALRKEEEAAADSYAGKMLFWMDYEPEGLARFLSQPQVRHETYKYHSAGTRAAIIRQAFEEEKRKRASILRLRFFESPGYTNPFSARLLAVV